MGASSTKQTCTWQKKKKKKKKKKSPLSGTWKQLKGGLPFMKPNKKKKNKLSLKPLSLKKQKKKSLSRGEDGGGRGGLGEHIKKRLSLGNSRGEEGGGKQREKRPSLPLRGGQTRV
ncbi:hypothetical protein PBY51_018365 [Eleginops maclovinus]|uniref:Uncharacterized protein n=1 Tax=Eleginops maclovinus TaxID=56733 RepID=A0AAN7Y759_ELEMC|nr:hypothetical protein PBY51_018365 [Eleginops maclovinus]